MEAGSTGSKWTLMTKIRRQYSKEEELREVRPTEGRTVGQNVLILVKQFGFAQLAHACGEVVVIKKPHYDAQYGEPEPSWVVIEYRREKIPFTSKDLESLRGLLQEEPISGCIQLYWTNTGKDYANNNKPKNFIRVLYVSANRAETAHSSLELAQALSMTLDIFIGAIGKTLDNTVTA